MQAGDRLKALKCLLRSGDTKSIVYYAGVSRSRDIYILAANYLQNLDWHDDPQVTPQEVHGTVYCVRVDHEVHDLVAVTYRQEPAVTFDRVSDVTAQAFHPNSSATSLWLGCGVP